jgi:hypothetical protein
MFLSALDDNPGCQHSARLGQRKSFIDVASNAGPDHAVLVWSSILREVNKMKQVGDLLREFGTEFVRCILGDNRRYNKNLLWMLASDRIQQCMTDHTRSGDNGFHNNQGIDLIFSLLFVALDDRRNFESFLIRPLSSWIKSGLPKAGKGYRSSTSSLTLPSECVSLRSVGFRD